MARRIVTPFSILIISSFTNYELRNNFIEFSCNAIVANNKLCSILQKKSGHIMEYIMEFQKLAQNSDIKPMIIMFKKGFHSKSKIS